MLGNSKHSGLSRGSGSTDCSAVASQGFQGATLVISMLSGLGFRVVAGIVLIRWLPEQSLQSPRTALLCQPQLNKPFQPNLLHLGTNHAHFKPCPDPKDLLAGALQRIHLKKDCCNLSETCRNVGLTLNPEP